MTARYEHPHSLRRALEDRLKTQARTSGLPLDRLRKEAAFERLLARFVVAAPEGSWALKGGLAMLARVGAHARTRPMPTPPGVPTPTSCRTRSLAPPELTWQITSSS